MKKALLIINLILPLLSSSLHGQKVVETKKIVTNLIRGQYELDGGIGLSDKYLGGYQSGRFILEISVDAKTKANYCWMQQQVFEQEYNPNLIRNGVNLSSNYSWNTVDGSYASGTYKINPIDSSVTFTWKKKYQNILPKAKLKKMNYDLILEVAKDNYFVKGFDYEGGEMYRSKSRLEQIAFDRKREEEDKIAKEKREEAEKIKRREEEKEQERKNRERNEQLAKENLKKEELMRAELEKEKAENFLKDLISNSRTIAKIELSSEFTATIKQAEEILVKIGPNWRFVFETDIKSLVDLNGMKGNFSNTRYLDWSVRNPYIVKNADGEYKEARIITNDYGFRKLSFKEANPQKSYNMFFVKSEQ
jgi:hypothetical protein